ncbi:response regulator transcription factor [Motiliproteus sediminis]|uniref:response regulator transcription factor n=1 Tax=Motiliproteus sediminis TaxID=1468178 RepID=UPI001AEF5611|nr:response regulator transcription factor [Motiliproteus sediminis]
MPALIAVVEDDPDQRHNYGEALRRRGYRIAAYADRVTARAGLLQHKPDLVLLDVMLGDEADAGFELCADLLGSYPELPVIFLSSRSDEIDQVFGLRLGAWDYQTKPVSLTLLVERVGALLKAAKRRALTPAVDAPSPQGLQLDRDRVAVKWQGVDVPLTVTECNLLAEIVARAGVVTTYDELAAVTRQTCVTNNTLNTHIRHIRRKFEQIDAQFAALENVYGAGYRWRGDGC